MTLKTKTQSNNNNIIVIIIILWLATAIIIIYTLKSFDQQKQWSAWKLSIPMYFPWKPSKHQ